MRPRLYAEGMQLIRLKKSWTKYPMFQRRGNLQTPHKVSNSRSTTNPQNHQNTSCLAPHNTTNSHVGEMENITSSRWRKSPMWYVFFFGLFLWCMHWCTYTVIADVGMALASSDAVFGIITTWTMIDGKLCRFIKLCQFISIYFGGSWIESWKSLDIIIPSLYTMMIMLWLSLSMNSESLSEAFRPRAVQQAALPSFWELRRCS